MWAEQCFNQISEGHYSESLTKYKDHMSGTKGLDRILGKNIQLSSLDKKVTNIHRKDLLSEKIYEKQHFL